MSIVLQYVNIYELSVAAAYTVGVLTLKIRNFRSYFVLLTDFTNTYNRLTPVCPSSSSYVKSTMDAISFDGAVFRGISPSHL